MPNYNWGAWLPYDYGFSDYKTKTQIQKAIDDINQYSYHNTRGQHIDNALARYNALLRKLEETPNEGTTTIEGNWPSQGEGITQQMLSRPTMARGLGAVAEASQNTMSRSPFRRMSLRPEQETSDINEQPEYFDEKTNDRPNFYAAGGAVMNPLGNNINPAIAQMAQGQEQDPIQRGLSQGYQAARQSIGLDEAQKQRALGMAMMKFAGNMATPGFGPGLAGRLAAINHSFSPASEAYQRQEAMSLQQNALAQKMAEDEKRRIEDSKHRQFMEQLQRESLEERRAYHQGALNHDRSTKDERLRQIGELKTEELQKTYPGAVSFDAMTPTERTQSAKEIRELSAKAPAYHKLLKNIDELESIVRKHPNLGYAMTAAWYPEGEGLIDSLIKSGMPQDEIFAIQRSRKLVKDMQKHEIKSAGGKTATNLYKQLVGETLPNITKNSSETNLAVLKDLKSEFEPVYAHAKLAPTMLSKRFLAPMVLPEIDKPQDSREKDANISTQRAGEIGVDMENIYQYATPEELEELKSLGGFE